MKRKHKELAKKITWRDGQFSDWTVVLGDREFKVHRQVLAGGSHACQFFVGAFNEAYGQEACRTDLTQSLPVETHAAFENVLDFIYGSTEKVLTPENCCALWMIGDFLQCSSLLDLIEEYITEFPDGSQTVLELAKESLQTSGLNALFQLLIPRVSHTHLHELVPITAYLSSADARQSVMSDLISCSQPVWLSWVVMLSLDPSSAVGIAKGKPVGKGKFRESLMERERANGLVQKRSFWHHNALAKGSAEGHLYIVQNADQNDLSALPGTFASRNVLRQVW